MQRRISLQILVNLDPVPGTFHTSESARNQVQKILTEAIPWYKPIVVDVSEDN